MFTVMFNGGLGRVIWKSEPTLASDGLRSKKDITNRNAIPKVEAVTNFISDLQKLKRLMFKSVERFKNILFRSTCQPFLSSSERMFDFADVY